MKSERYYFRVKSLDVHIIKNKVNGVFNPTQMFRDPCHFVATSSIHDSLFSFVHDNAVIFVKENKETDTHVFVSLELKRKKEN